MIPAPGDGQILLVVTPYVGGQAVFDLVARLALQGALEVADGGNTFNAYHVARALRRQTQAYAQAMGRIRLSRAFTCYQLAALLADLERQPGASASPSGDAVPPLPGSAAQPVRGGVPLLALDFLNSFADQNVAVPERRRLLKECLARLRRMSGARPVGLWVRARTAAPEEMSEFLGLLERAAGRVWRLDHLTIAGPQQAILFPD